MNKKRNKFGGISGIELLIVLVVGLLTWLGINHYNKIKENNENDKEVIISLPYKEQFDRLKSEYDDLEKKLEEKGKTIISLENNIKDKGNEILRLEALGTDTAKLRSELENREQELASANNNITQLTNINNSLNKGIKRAKEGLASASAVISVLRKENITFKEERKILGTVRTKIKESAKGYSGKSDFTSKFVVLTQSVDVELSRNEVSTICGINVGEGDLIVTYKDNKVQYYVDLERLSDQDIQFDMDSKTVNIYIASPKLDEDMVEVQSNPENIIKKDNSSWLKIGIDIDKMKDDIQAKVRREVLEAGSHDMYKASARRNAKEKLKELFNKILGKFLEEKHLDLNVIVYD